MRRVHKMPGYGLLAAPIGDRGKPELPMQLGVHQSCWLLPMTSEHSRADLLSVIRVNG